MSLFTVTLVFGCLYAGTLGGLWLLNRSPALPWEFVPFLLLIAAPMAVTLHGLLYLGPQHYRFTQMRPEWRWLCVIGGVGVTYLAREPLWLIGAAIVACLTCRHWSRSGTLRTAAIFTSVVLGYAIVWNVNYLIALPTAASLRDPWLLSFDARVFAHFTGAGGEYQAVFPLIRNPIGFKLLENAYLLLFPQVITLMLMWSADAASAAGRWLVVFFGMYAAGLAVFLIVPAVGPPIYHPESFDPRFSETVTFGLMNAMAMEYRQVLAGGHSTGIGYFVAVPSLHVAVAVFLQRAMKPHPFVYWTWLPINVLLVSSTVLLGYHYLLDLPAGFALGVLAGRFLPSAAPTDSVHEWPVVRSSEPANWEVPTQDGAGETSTT